MSSLVLVSSVAAMFADQRFQQSFRIADDFARSLAAHTKETLAVRIVLIAPDA